MELRWKDPNLVNFSASKSDSGNQILIKRTKNIAMSFNRQGLFFLFIFLFLRICITTLNDKNSQFPSPASPFSLTKGSQANFW